MPRIDVGSSSERTGWVIPWKLILPVAVIGSTIWYVGAQYVRLHPTPSRPQAAAVNKPKATPNRIAAMQPLMAKLDLTAEQKEKIKSLSDESTNPVTFRRKAMQVLTVDQRKEAKVIVQEAAAEQKKIREEKQAKFEAKQAKLFPGNDLAVAKAANEQMRKKRLEKMQAGKAQNTVTPAIVGAAQ